MKQFLKQIQADKLKSNLDDIAQEVSSLSFEHRELLKKTGWDLLHTARADKKYFFALTLISVCHFARNKEQHKSLDFKIYLQHWLVAMQDSKAFPEDVMFTECYIVMMNQFPLIGPIAIKKGCTDWNSVEYL